MASTWKFSCHVWTKPHSEYIQSTRRGVCSIASGRDRVRIDVTTSHNAFSESPEFNMKALTFPCTDSLSISRWLLPLEILGQLILSIIHPNLSDLHRAGSRPLLPPLSAACAAVSAACALVEGSRFGRSRCVSNEYVLSFRRANNGLVFPSGGRRTLVGRQTAAAGGPRARGSTVSNRDNPHHSAVLCLIAASRSYIRVRAPPTRGPPQQTNKEMAIRRRCPRARFSPRSAVSTCVFSTMVRGQLSSSI